MDLCILLCVFLSCISSLSASRCPRHEVGSLVKMPRGRAVLSLNEFDDHVANRPLAEFYLVTPNPTPLDALVNFNSVFSKNEDGTYEEQSFGETKGDDATCVRIEDTLTTIRKTRKAFFYSENLGNNITFWSSCPTSYVMAFECQPAKSVRNRCPVENSFISIWVTGTADDVPLTNILKDLRRATGIKFGSESFRWFFTYGEAKICAAENDS